MTTLLLVRHAITDAVGRILAGRTPGCHLDVRGRDQARKLARSLANTQLAAVYTSPLERAIETAAEIARFHKLTPCVAAGLNEIDFGAWEGYSFEELDKDSGWRSFNSSKSAFRPPGGESMMEAQVRIVDYVKYLLHTHRGETVVLVSHCDPLRLLIAHWLGIPIDLLTHFEISPASVSAARGNVDGFQVLYLNHTV